MQQRILDNRVLKNYVSPLYCQQLMYAGYSVNEKFTWRVYESDIILDSSIFDIDDYYKDGNKALDEVAPPKMILPAFTINDIERYLPDFCVCRCNRKYEISIDENYKIEAVSDDRLPDAFARMMLAAIKKRVINVKELVGI